MRKVKHVEIGDYVLLSQWADKDFHDPWHIGHITEYGTDSRGRWYRLADATRSFRHCWKISHDEGRQRFADSRAQGIPCSEVVHNA